MSEDESDTLLWTRTAALEAGTLAVVALSRGEAASLTELVALANVLEDPHVMITEAARAAAASVRELHQLLVLDASPSSEARELAERCRIALTTPPPPITRTA